MGVYIKGAKKPKSCGECPAILYGMGDIICFITKDRILEKSEQLRSCPLVEIKEPHGRLIDVDVLKSDLEKKVEDSMSDIHKATVGLDIVITKLVEATCIDADIRTAKEWFDRQPTVIEAEVE